ncbi:formate C-acetyltransferase/glycerol dehydratase family glycyl radical enzyme [Zooshikella marina]|uniref:formate C-acetyltransferase/glycerol dehydratase family glycyl radical enzyme n=1 Tax=Zooshikella ganghwensis TaxID=202772 RepID=UPI001BAEC290|nr:formate C-acetyltransferase/glycerol dehydratase family glycyl radical enzyme [Zooshikella ganghwensis]MBU2704903.1 formate C-acetyltransferase/glycerol dehydratase family glycyl radical enzyme [Zooshikella ganghwensis]
MNLDYLPLRIQKHKEVLINIIKPPVCTERAVAYTRVYQKNPTLPVMMKRALALSEHLETRTIWIDNDELIIGNQASYLRAAPIFPEYTVNWLANEIDALADRPGAGFSLSEVNKNTLKEIIPFWQGKTAQDQCYAQFTDEQKAILDSGIIKAEGNMTSGDAHLAINNKKLLAKGLDGLLADVKLQKQLVSHNSEESHLGNTQFLDAVHIVIEAVQKHIKRYAKLAAEMAHLETRAFRKRELVVIAENCNHIAHQKPETFWQALQLCYFVQLILQIESNGHSVSFGRMDQYLYPFYKKDVEQKNQLTRGFALELLQSCWLKLLEVNKIRSGTHSKASAGSPLYQNVTIGGQQLDQQGYPIDAVNSLSFAILESCGQLRSTQPNLSVRYHQNICQDFLLSCLTVVKCGFGMPAFNNDQIVIPAFIDLGVSREDAYNYAAIGCIETAVPGKWGYRCTGMSFLNFARVLLAALDEGKDATTQQVFLAHEKSLNKGNFNNFDEVMSAWQQQVQYFTRHSVAIDAVVDTALEQLAPDIFCSALVDDCISRAKSIKEGGSVYDWVSGLQVGIANLGNSLAVLKQLVFEQEKVSQPALAKALADNFNGIEGEQLRQVLINYASKYGNDDCDVDKLLVQAYDMYIDELTQHKNTRFGRGPIGGGYYAGTSSISANVPFGANTMATPDGRKAYAPLAEGASPASGTDTHGPTAVYSSIAKLPTDKILGGVLLNQKLTPGTLETEQDFYKLSMLIRTFFDVYKGWHVQYNIVSRETLLAAQANPQEYRDLVVRVAGYSAFFTALSVDAQNDIIARTEHCL